MLIKNYPKTMLALEDIVDKVFEFEDIPKPDVALRVDKNMLECFLITGRTIGTNTDTNHFAIQIHNTGMSYRDDLDSLDNMRIGDYINFKINKKFSNIDFRKLDIYKYFVNLLFITLHETMHIVDYLKSNNKKDYLMKQMLSEIRTSQTLSEIDDMNYPYMSCVIYRNAFPEKQVNERVIRFIIYNMDVVLETLGKLE